MGKLPVYVKELGAVADGGYNAVLPTRATTLRSPRLTCGSNVRDATGGSDAPVRQILH